MKSGGAYPAARLVVGFWRGSSLCLIELVESHGQIVWVIFEVTVTVIFAGNGGVTVPEILEVEPVGEVVFDDSEVVVGKQLV